MRGTMVFLWVLAFFCWVGLLTQAVRGPREVLHRSYEDGFGEGFRAYLEQSGTYLPVPSAPRGQGFEKGYEDGYHHATKCENCPF